MYCKEVLLNLFYRISVVRRPKFYTVAALAGLFALLLGNLFFEVGDADAMSRKPEPSDLQATSEFILSQYRLDSVSFVYRRLPTTRIVRGPLDSIDSDLCDTFESYFRDLSPRAGPQCKISIPESDRIRRVAWTNLDPGDHLRIVKEHAFWSFWREFAPATDRVEDPVIQNFLLRLRVAWSENGMGKPEKYPPLKIDSGLVEESWSQLMAPRVQSMIDQGFLSLQQSIVDLDFDGDLERVFRITYLLNKHTDVDNVSRVDENTVFPSAAACFDDLKSEPYHFRTIFVMPDDDLGLFSGSTHNRNEIEYRGGGYGLRSELSANTEIILFDGRTYLVAGFGQGSLSGIGFRRAVTYSDTQTTLFHRICSFRGVPSFEGSNSPLQ